MKQLEPLADNGLIHLDLCILERVVLSAYFCV